MGPNSSNARRAQVCLKLGCTVSGGRHQMQKMRVTGGEDNGDRSWCMLSKNADRKK